MDRWTRRMGYPCVNAVLEGADETALTLRLRQEWFLADGSLTAEEAEQPEAVWQVPLSFQTANSLSARPALLHNREQRFRLAASQGDFVKVNAGQRALARVHYDEALLGRLTAAIAGDFPGAQLSEVDAASLLLDGFALLRAGRSGLRPLAALLQAVGRAQETGRGTAVDYTLWSAVSGVLQGLLGVLEEAAARSDRLQHGLQGFRRFAAGLLTRGLASLGWENLPGEEHTRRLLRALLIGMLDKFAAQDESVLAEASRRFQAFHRHLAAGETDAAAAVLPGDFRATVFRLVLADTSSSRSDAALLEDYEAVLRTFTSTEDNQEKKYALFSLGAARDERLQRRTLQWSLLSGAVKLQDFFYPIDAVAASGRAGSALAWSYLQEHFSEVQEKLSKASPSLMGAVISYSTGRFCSNERADEIEAFFQRHPVPACSRVISQILERMRANAKLVELIAKEHEDFPEMWAAP